MDMPCWLRTLGISGSPRRASGKGRRQAISPVARNRHRLLLEQLEDRTMLSVTWINPAGGNWESAGNWSTDAVPGPSDDVIIGALNSGAAVNIGGPADFAKSITASAPITLKGSINVAGTISDSSTIALQGGTLINATISAGTTLQAARRQPQGTPQGTLKDVTLAGTLSLQAAGNGGDAIVAIAGAGLTLAGGTVILAGTLDNLAFGGTQTLAGTGTVTIGPQGGITDAGAGNVLTIASGVTVQLGAAGFIDVGTASLDNFGTINGNAAANLVTATINATNWVNHGTIQGLGLTGVTLAGSWTNATDGQILANGGAVSLTGIWTNNGVIDLSNSGIVNLGDTFTLASLGTLNRTPTTGGTINLTGTLELTGGTLDASTGPWSLKGGTIVGGTVTDNLLATRRQPAGTPQGTLKDVTLAGTLSLQAAGNGGDAIVAIAGAGLTLAGGTVILGGTSDNLAFGGTQTLAGTGTVTIGPQGGITDAGAGNVLTIASGVTVQLGAAGFINVGTASLDNFGTINGNAPANVATATVSGTNWVNHGIIQGLGLTGVTLAGSWTNATDGQILANVGTVNLTGNWSNSGTIGLSNGGTVDLGGTLTLGSLGIVNRTPTTGGIINLTGTLELTGGTLDASTGPWTLDGGTIVGGTVTDNLLAAKTISTVQDVTLAGTLTLPAAGGGLVATVAIAGAGLTLAGGTVILSGNADDLAFTGTQTLEGTGTVSITGNGGITDAGAGNVLTIGADVTVHGGNSAVINVGTANLDNLGTINGDPPGNGHPLSITATNWVNHGTIQAGAGSSVTLASSVSIDQSGILHEAIGATITAQGNLVGNTTDAALFAPKGTVTLAGSGTAAAPQLLEAMSNDLGAVAAGFQANFAFDTLALGNNTYVRLVDNAHNSAGTSAEAVYADALVVPSGTSLNLNGLHLYARTAQIGGSVLNGSVTLVPDGGPVPYATPTHGDIAQSGTVDDWTFFGRAGQTIQAFVGTGSGSLFTPVSPTLNFAQVQLVAPNASIVSTASNSSSGTDATLQDVTLPADGTYHIRIQAGPGHTTNTGNYLLTLWDATVHTSALNLNQTTVGQLASPYEVDKWTFAASANQQVRFEPAQHGLAGLSVRPDRAERVHRVQRVDHQLGP